eukprot:282705-Hanusia_phi.AAC.2
MFTSERWTKRSCKRRGGCATRHQVAKGRKQAKGKEAASLNAPRLFLILLSRACKNELQETSSSATTEHASSTLAGEAAGQVEPSTRVCHEVGEREVPPAGPVRS